MTEQPRDESARPGGVTPNAGTASGRALARPNAGSTPDRTRTTPCAGNTPDAACPTPSAGSAPIVCFLTGATAVGKSDVALLLAERHGWEIVSVDSRQIYRRMEIGTAKPSAEETSRVRHHLLDLLDPNEVASAGWFRERFLEAQADLASRGQKALAVGGTGLYWEAAIRGLHALPSASPELRKELEAMVEREGLSAVFARLAGRDPDGAAGIDRYNRHRVIRACELVELTGRTLQEIYSGAREGEQDPVPASGSLPVAGDAAGDTVRSVTPPVVVLSRPRPVLRERIARRCEAMLEAGLLGEIRALLDSGVEPDAPGLRTVGYREFLPHLLGGAPLDECRSRFVIQTRQYAKRQETWFRNRLPHAVTIEIEEGESAEETSARVDVALEVGHL
ncbi:MAG: tRNA (adenosine(37)-N6)-dimethylallyltransferase MiaA [Candidatus Eisenbacteria bacterium]